MSLSDIFSVFFEEAEAGSPSNFDDEEDDDGAITGGGGDAESNDIYWAGQHQLIDEALNRSSSIEKRVRIDTEAALQKMHSTMAVCRCSSGRSMKGHCRDCGLKDIADQLREMGYNSALCKSKWRRTLDIPSGEHTYIDVVVETNKGHVRVVIELNFRAEFEMARAKEEYNSLVGRLPEVFVGKSDKLRKVVKIVCAAAKKCMKDNRMHMAPWRKHKYMQSKWLGTCQRMPAVAPMLPEATMVSSRKPRQRASMLAFDLHLIVVEVL